MRKAETLICRTAAAVMVATIAIFALSGRTQGAVTDDPSDRMVLAIAQKQLEAGGLDVGYKLLLVLEYRHPDDPKLQLLLARTEAARNDLGLATRRLELLVDRDPDWKPGRVALIKAYIAEERWREAKGLLVAELGRDPSEDERRNIERMARAVADQQTFVGRWSFGLVPDTNINNGTNADTVQFLGLPFTLNDEAKAQRGVRADISLGGTVRSRWRGNTRIEASADASHSEPLGDEGKPTANYRLGLAVRTRGEKAGLTAGMAVQPFFFESDKLRTETSLYVQPVRRITGRHYGVGSLTLTEGAVNNSTARDFRQWETTIGPSIGFGDTGRLHLYGVVGHRNAKDNVFSFLRRGVSLGLAAAPWNGWRIDFESSLTRDVYEDINVAFAKRQEDLTAEASVGVTRTGWVFFGVSPKLGLRWSETRSTIDLFDRDSLAITAGLTLPY